MKSVSGWLPAKHGRPHAVLLYSPFTPTPEYLYIFRHFEFPLLDCLLFIHSRSLSDDRINFFICRMDFGDKFFSDFFQISATNPNPAEDTMKRPGFKNPVRNFRIRQFLSLTCKLITPLRPDLGQHHTMQCFDYGILIKSQEKFLGNQ